MPPSIVPPRIVPRICRETGCSGAARSTIRGRARNLKIREPISAVFWLYGVEGGDAELSQDKRIVGFINAEGRAGLPPSQKEKDHESESHPLCKGDRVPGHVCDSDRGGRSKCEWQSQLVPRYRRSSVKSHLRCEVQVTTVAGRGHSQHLTLWVHWKRMYGSRSHVNSCLRYWQPCLSQTVTCPTKTPSRD